MKRERERRSRAGRALDGNAAVHGFHEVFHDRKAEAGSAKLARTAGVDAIEALENPRKMFRRDAGACIGNADAHGSILHLGAHAHARAFRAVLERIIDEISDDMIEGTSI